MIAESRPAFTISVAEIGAPSLADRLSGKKQDLAAAQ
jgi:hypothetical protein